MLNIAICDDEDVQTALLSSFVTKWASARDQTIAISTYASAESFSFAWSGDKRFDLLLLDIQMSGQSGIELARDIRRKDESLTILFITGLSDYINEGYEVSALHYLIKPIKEEKLFACLDKACKKIIAEQPTHLIAYNGEYLRLYQKDIFYVEAFAHTVAIQTQEAVYEIRKNIGQMENELDARMFVRTHRSYLVGLKHIGKIGKTELTLDTGQALPVSRRLYPLINQAFIGYYRGEP